MKKIISNLDRKTTRKEFKGSGYRNEYQFLDSLSDKQYFSLMLNYKSNDVFYKHMYLVFVCGFALSVILYLIDVLKLDYISI